MTMASGCWRLDLGNGDLVVARDGDIGADAGQQLDEVVGERVVVVEQEDLHPSPPMAASMEAAFDGHLGRLALRHRVGDDPRPRMDGRDARRG